MHTDPGQADALYRLGLLAHQQGRHDAAIDYLTQSLRSNPNAPAAHFFLGRALQAQGQLEEAVGFYRESLRLHPASAAGHNNLGDALFGLRRLAEAEAVLREAIRLKADFPEAHSNLGLVLVARGQWDEAAPCLRESIRLRPNHAPAHERLGYALWEGGRLREALASFDEAIRLKPDFAEARRNRGMLLLLLGDWERGWAEYEWRSRRAGYPPAPPLPLWDGSPLGGRTILLWTEQGLGDTLQFIRYAPLVKARGGTVIVACQEPLLRLLRGCPGVDRVVIPESAAEWQAADVYVPLLSLAGLFRTTPATVPARVPYLFTDPALTESWRRELAPLGGFKVGIAWQGNPKFLGDAWRSVPLSEFAPVAVVPGVRLFSLEKEEVGREQLPPLAERFGLTDLAPRLADFVDTAAVMTNLDLVITSDTSVAHLGGALGVPVWLAARRSADWRWLLDREDSPWYPTLRIFRQATAGDWADVFARIAAALRALTIDRFAP